MIKLRVKRDKKVNSTATKIASVFSTRNTLAFFLILGSNKSIYECNLFILIFEWNNEMKNALLFVSEPSLNPIKVFQKIINNS